MSGAVRVIEPKGEPGNSTLAILLKAGHTKAEVARLAGSAAFLAKTVSFSIGFTYLIGFLVVAWHLSRVKDGNARRSIPYKLLAVTEKSYVVLPQPTNQKSLQFDRESV